MYDHTSAGEAAMDRAMAEEWRRIARREAASASAREPRYPDGGVNRFMEIPATLSCVRYLKLFKSHTIIYRGMFVKRFSWPPVNLTFSNRLIILIL